MTFTEFAYHRTPLGYVISDGGQHQTTSLQSTQAVTVAVKRLVCVRSYWSNSASEIVFPAVTNKILYRQSRFSQKLFSAAAANQTNYSATAVTAAA